VGHGYQMGLPVPVPVRTLTCAIAYIALVFGGWTFLCPTPPPTPLENKHNRSFRGLGLPLASTTLKTSLTARFRVLDLHLATTTTTHNPRKRARPLVFGGWAFLWPPPPPTPPENKPLRSFLGGVHLRFR
jgi:hypothetical protein